jgi:hypothetical protein
MVLVDAEIGSHDGTGRFLTVLAIAIRDEFGRVRLGCSSSSLALASTRT